MSALNIDDAILKKITLSAQQQQQPRDPECCGVSQLQVLRVLHECNMLVVSLVGRDREREVGREVRRKVERKMKNNHETHLYFS